MHRWWTCPAVVAAMVVLSGVAHATNWSSQTHSLYPGDFDGDGRDDLLVIARDPGSYSGIFTATSGQPSTQLQSWSSGFLGINWHSGTYTAVVGDFNCDQRDDVLLQRTTSDKSFVLLANSAGRLYAIHQVLTNWDQTRYRIIAGDFNADGCKDLFLQARQSSGTNYIMHANGSGSGQFAAAQSWSNNHLGFKWSVQNALVHVGDFNNDNRDDLLVQAKADIALIDYDVPIPVPVYKPQAFGIALATAGGQFASIHQLWSRKDLGVDWAAGTADIVIGDFNGDGRDDVMLVARRSGQPTHIMLTNSNGQISSAPAQTLSPGSAGTDWTAADYRMIAADFNADGRMELYRQATAPSGTNGIVSFTSGGTVSAVSTHAAPSVTSGLATAIGRLPGEFSVSAQGAATYEIPIDVPAGTNGLKPSLSLTYSMVGNGLLGAGWGIAGLSEIARCASTVDQDGVARAVELSANDRFCLGGNKLRGTGGGAYGAHEKTYRTEVDAFSRVTSYTSGAPGYAPTSGPQYFRVEGKDGLYYFYGATEDARVQVTGTSMPRVWALNRIEDRSGNYLTISYAKGTDGGGAFNGSYRPDTIEWARTGAAGGPYFKAIFVYENRPAADIDTQYFAGGSITEVKRLDRLEIQAYEGSAWGVVRQYDVNYEPALSSSSMSRIASITQCSASECLPATTFQYQNGTPGWSASDTSSTSNSAAMMEYSYAIDINGDGRDDLVYPQSVIGQARWHFMTANASGTFNAPVNTGIDAGDSTNLQYAKAQPIDYYSEGRISLLVDVPGYGTRQLLRWTGSTLALTSTNLTLALGGNEWVADFDGDGRSDVLYATSSGNTGYLHVHSNAGSTSGTAQFGAAQQFYSAALNGAITPFSGEYASWLSKLMDFNGDGRGDFIHSSTSGSCSVIGGGMEVCAWTTNWSALVSTGSSFTQVLTWTCTSVTTSSCAVVPLVADFNGDGLSDVITQTGQTGALTWRVSYGSGTGLSSPVTLTMPADFKSNGFTEDYDNDGRADLLYAPSSTSGSWYVLRSAGSSFEAPLAISINSSSANNTIRTLDLDGDGLRDIGYKNGAWQVRKHNGVAADLVKSITDGFGNNVTVTYASLTDGAIYTKGTGASFPQADLQAPMHVVSSYSASTGISSPATYSVNYRYEGARVHLQGRGFLGFAKRTRTDGRPGYELKTVETFRQDFPFIGNVASEVTYQPGSATKISEVTYGYDKLDLDGTQRVFPFNNSVIEDKYEVGGPYDGQQISRFDDHQHVRQLRQPHQSIDGRPRCSRQFAAAGSRVPHRSGEHIQSE